MLSLNNKIVKMNSKGFSLVELLVVILILGILSSVVTVSYFRYRKNSQLQVLKLHGDVMAKSLLDCMSYKEVKECLTAPVGESKKIPAYEFFSKIEVEKFKEPVKRLKASFHPTTGERNFCFQFFRRISGKKYKLCVDVDRKTKVIRSVFPDRNFCCSETDKGCVLPVRPTLSILNPKSSEYCKNEGYSEDFYSYLSKNNYKQKSSCNEGVCIQFSSPPPSPPSPPRSCPAGQRLIGSQCISACPSGGAWNPRTSSCVSCPSGTYSNRFECITCRPPAIRWDTTTNSCIINCPPDRPIYNPSRNDCMRGTCPSYTILRNSLCESI